VPKDGAHIADVELEKESDVEDGSMLSKGYIEFGILNIEY
jgi:hypothetical protein